MYAAYYDFIENVKYLELRRELKNAGFQSLKISFSRTTRPEKLRFT
jgi:hypothetical protein